ITLLDPGTYEVQASAYGEDTVKFSLGSIVVEKDNKTTAARLKIDHIDLTKTTKGIIQFENMTTDTITYLYKRTVGGNFGSDMLGFVTTLKSNDYFYAFVEPGTYDFKANTRTSSSESGIDYYSFKSSFPTGIVIEKSAIKKWSISASDKL
ncbi:MAG TPA: hypothetical protein PK771_15770, partial [Spirochaetota bacterium]|nr:hypothetical protein [Spirochaetota bacterium]